LTNAEVEAKVQQLTTAVKTRIVTRIESDFRSTVVQEAVKWPLEMANTYEALANLELIRGSAAAATPGKGVTIGLIDTGIHSSHHAFQYTGSGAITRKLLRSATQEATGAFSHGTAVASIAAGRYYGAYGATVKMFVIPLGSGGGTYTPITLQQLSSIDNSDSQLYNTVLGNNLDILNLSFGFPGGIENYTEKQLRDNYSKTIKALAQADKQKKTILVWSVGNHGTTQGATPSPPELWPVSLQESANCKATPSQC